MFLQNADSHTVCIHDVCFFVVVCKIWTLLLQSHCVSGETSQLNIIRKAKSFGLYRYTGKTPEQHENNYTDWCCLLWFPFASFILLRPNRYLHFSSSDYGLQAKGKVSRNAYTALTQPAGAVFLFLLAFRAQPHTKTPPPLLFPERSAHVSMGVMYMCLLRRWQTRAGL